MRAARLYDNAESLVVEDLDDPSAPEGCAVVAVEAVFMSPYMGELIAGNGGFSTPRRPFTPGMDCVGSIVAIGGGVTSVAVGDRVFCDSYIEATSQEGRTEYAFAGCFDISGGGGEILERWRDGALATHIVLPAECLTAVAPALSVTSADVLCRLGWMGTAYGGFAHGGLRTGSSVAVYGATGLVGVSAVVVALAMGAGRICAVGRSPDRLAAFDGLDDRVETSTEIPDGIDMVLNTVDADDPAWIDQAVAALNRGGSMISVASVNPTVPTPDFVTRELAFRGSLWFPRDAPAALVRMIAEGRLPVDRFRVHAYGLDDVGAAVDHAARGVSPFEHVVVRP
ncbi:MAG: zinc-binding dehydrogenase [bacterium]|nr:zinc-binding dehydrogenase [bacterium]